MSWVDLLVDNRGLRAVFGDTDPVLEWVDIHEVRLDRHGVTLFVRFDLAEYPSPPPKKWAALEANTVQVELALSSIQNVTIEGWGAARGAHIEITKNSDGRIELACRDSPNISATGEWLSLRMMRAHKSSVR